MKLLFMQMAVVLLTARTVAAAFRRIGQPEVVGEMTAGILLGPSLLGRISPALMDRLFPAASFGTLYAVSQVGLVLFMFMVGLHLRPQLIRQSARAIVGASETSIALPFACGALLALWAYPTFGNGAAKLPFVLFVSAAMSITAFPVLARILSDRGLTNTRVGVVAISCAAVDDVSAWCMLAVITVLARASGVGALPFRFAMLALYLAVMLLVLHPILKRFVPTDRVPGTFEFSWIMVLLLVSVWATEALAVHALFGAFVAGVIMPKGGQLETALRERLEPVTVVLLLPLFFAYNGLRTSVVLLNSPGLWAVCALIVGVAIASKLLGSAVAVRLSGLTWRESFAVGALVNTRGLVELVILNVGLDLHILTPTLFSMMVVMALATTIMTSPLIDWIDPALKAEAVPVES